MKRIAIVLNTSWNIYNFRISLIDDLLELGYRVVLFAPYDESSSKLTQMGYNYIQLNNLSRKGTNPIKDVMLVRELKQNYINWNIDIVIHFTIKPNIYGSIAASQIGIPSIAVVTGLGYTFLSRGLASFAAKKLYKLAFQRNDITIFQNPDDRKLFLDHSLVSDNKSIVIYGSGIDTIKFNSNRTYKKLNRVLFIGRLLKDKGIYELLEAFEKFNLEFPHVSLDIVGAIDRGNPASLNEKEISNINNNSIQFHGFKTDIRAHIENSDVVILPSYREGLPRTMLEALSMSKPIITTDVPGCREVVDNNNNGFLVKPKDSRSLYNALKKFYILPDKQLENMGNFSRALALKYFDNSIINGEYLSVINKLC